VEIVYNQNATIEGIEAAVWYEERSEGLRHSFLKKWKEAENRMVANPELNRRFQDDLRRCRFETFPYALIYRLHNDLKIEVVAVMHLNRRPGYWNEEEQP